MLLYLNSNLQLPLFVEHKPNKHPIYLIIIFTDTLFLYTLFLSSIFLWMLTLTDPFLFKQHLQLPFCFENESNKYPLYFLSIPSLFFLISISTVTIFLPTLTLLVHFFIGILTLQVPSFVKTQDQHLATLFVSKNAPTNYPPCLNTSSTNRPIFEY